MDTCLLFDFSTQERELLPEVLQQLAVVFPAMLFKQELLEPRQTTGRIDGKGEKRKGVLPLGSGGVTSSPSFQYGIFFLATRQ